MIKRLTYAFHFLLLAILVVGCDETTSESESSNGIVTINNVVASNSEMLIYYTAPSDKRTLQIKTKTGSKDFSEHAYTIVSPGVAKITTSNNVPYTIKLRLIGKNTSAFSNEMVATAAASVSIKHIAANSGSVNIYYEAPQDGRTLRVFADSGIFGEVDYSVNADGSLKVISTDGIETSYKIQYGEVFSTDRTATSAPFTVTDFVTEESKVTISFERPYDTRSLAVFLDNGTGFAKKSHSVISATSVSVGVTAGETYTVRLSMYEATKTEISSNIDRADVKPTSGESDVTDAWTEIANVADGDYSSVISALLAAIEDEKQVMSPEVKSQARFTLGSAYYLNGDLNDAGAAYAASNETEAPYMGSISYSLGDSHAHSVSEALRGMVMRSVVVNANSQSFMELPYYDTTDVGSLQSVMTRRNVLLGAALSAYIEADYLNASIFLTSYEAEKKPDGSLHVNFWYHESLTKTNPQHVGKDQLYEAITRLQQNGKIADVLQPLFNKIQR